MTQKAITIQYSGVQGQQKNTSYPFKAEITCIDDMKKVAAFDHVCATYRRMADRSKEVFQQDTMPGISNCRRLFKRQRNTAELP